MVLMPEASPLFSGVSMPGGLDLLARGPPKNIIALANDIANFFYQNAVQTRKLIS